MFTIEHEFDATVITVVDEGSPHLQGDLIATAFEDCVTLVQVDPHTDREQRITLSLQQLRDLRAAMDLPEGAYRARTT